MLRIAFIVFLALHGLVHLLYAAQSRRLFELQPGLAWPGGSWAFARLLGSETIRAAAGAACVLAALGFIAGAAGLLLGQSWGVPLVAAAAVLSSLLYLFFWDGAWQQLDDKGGVGLLINAAILVVLFAFPDAVLGPSL